MDGAACQVAVFNGVCLSRAVHVSAMRCHGVPRIELVKECIFELVSFCLKYSKVIGDCSREAATHKTRSSQLMFSRVQTLTNDERAEGGGQGEACRASINGASAHTSKVSRRETVQDPLKRVLFPWIREILR